MTTPARPRPCRATENTRSPTPDIWRGIRAHSGNAWYEPGKNAKQLVSMNLADGSSSIGMMEPSGLRKWRLTTTKSVPGVAAARRHSSTCSGSSQLSASSIMIAG